MAGTKTEGPAADPEAQPEFRSPAIGEPGIAVCGPNPILDALHRAGWGSPVDPEGERRAVAMRWARLVALGVVLGLVLAILAMILAVPLAAGEPYKRPRWADLDHDGWDTRTEMLVMHCRFTELVKNRVRKAVCGDSYTGLEIATDTAAQSLQIDHLLPASSAWKRRSWTKKEFEAFFNDTDNLAITRSRTNERKGDRLPHQWCPAEPGVRRMVAEAYERVAAKYRLRLSAGESRGLAYWKRLECAPGAKVLGFN